jgi:AraC family transcriptional regulator
MIARIVTLSAKKLVGMHLKMNLANNKTFELWSGFMPKRKEIKNCISNDLISMQVYDSAYNFEKFDINAFFVKWAAVEVTNFENIPNGMESFVLEGGLYAVFDYKGNASNAVQTFQYIFQTWLPNSNYKLDNRPHFELLGAKYKNNDPNSEEEIWIPIKSKIIT